MRRRYTTELTGCTRIRPADRADAGGCPSKEEKSKPAQLRREAVAAPSPFWCRHGYRWKEVDANTDPGVPAIRWAIRSSSERAADAFKLTD